MMTKLDTWTDGLSWSISIAEEQAYKVKNLICFPYLIKLVGLLITIYTNRSNTKEFYFLSAELMSEKALITSLYVSNCMVFIT